MRKFVKREISDCFQFDRVLFGAYSIHVEFEKNANRRH